MELLFRLIWKCLIFLANIPVHHGSWWEPSLLPKEKWIIFLSSSCNVPSAADSPLAEKVDHDSYIPSRTTIYIFEPILFLPHFRQWWLVYKSCSHEALWYRVWSRGNPSLVSSLDGHVFHLSSSNQHRNSSHSIYPYPFLSEPTTMQTKFL